MAKISRLEQVILSLEHAITQKLASEDNSRKRLLRTIPEIDEHVQLNLRRQGLHVSLRLRNLMAKQGLDTVALAWSSQVSEKTIRKVIKGKKLPRLNTLLKLAEAQNTRVALVFEPFYGFAQRRSTKTLWFAEQSEQAQNLGKIVTRFMWHLPVGVSLNRNRNKVTCPSFRSIFCAASGLGYRTRVHLYREKAK